MSNIVHKKKRFSSSRKIVLGFAATILVGALLLMLPISSKSGVVTPFNQGFAAVMEQGKGGIIDKTGKFVFPPLAKYEGIGPLQAGLAPFKNSNKWGYVNAQGTIAIPAQYEEAGAFQK